MSIYYRTSQGIEFRGARPDAAFAAHQAAAREAVKYGVSWVGNIWFPNRPSSALGAVQALKAGLGSSAWFNHDDWCWYPLNLDVKSEPLKEGMAA